MAPPRVWLVTGASSGFGREIALRALRAGDRVIATSRDLDRLADLREAGAAPLRLDQSESLDEIRAVAKAALGIYGGVDVVVASAAYAQLGTLEEASPEETLASFQTNVFGPLNLYRALLPHFRAKRAGTLCTIGSMAGWYGEAGGSLYCAAKAALRILGQGLEAELAPFGLRHCTIEPGYFRTNFLRPHGNYRWQEDPAGRIEDYRPVHDEVAAGLAAAHGAQQGDPVLGAEVIFDVLTQSGVARGREVPSFLPLGSDALFEIRNAAERALAAVKEWEAISAMTDFK